MGKKKDKKKKQKKIHQISPWSDLPRDNGYVPSTCNGTEMCHCDRQKC